MYSSGLDNLLATVTVNPRPVGHPLTAFDQLMRLDSWNGGGLTHAEFRNLIVQCSCGLLMTRRAFRGHTCAQGAGVQMGLAAAQPGPVIDLTLDSDDDSDSVIDLTLDEDLQ
jgi:hypothetical protein